MAKTWSERKLYASTIKDRGLSGLCGSCRDNGFHQQFLTNHTMTLTMLTAVWINDQGLSGLCGSCRDNGFHQQFLTNRTITLWIDWCKSTGVNTIYQRFEAMAFIWKGTHEHLTKPCSAMGHCNVLLTWELLELFYEAVLHVCENIVRRRGNTAGGISVNF